MERVFQSGIESNKSIFMNDKRKKRKYTFEVHCIIEFQQYEKNYLGSRFNFIMHFLLFVIWGPSIYLVF